MNIDYIKLNPKQFAQKAKVSELEKVIKLAAKKYYGGENPLFSDIVYDTLIDELEIKDKSNVLLKNIGFKSQNDKVKLPYFMASMNKVKTNDGIKHWIIRYNSNNKFVISSKLDGISALYCNNNFYTRGNGEYGRNISHLLDYLKLPKIEKDVALRGELIISRDNFNKHRGNYTSARSMVNGLVAMKENIDLISILEFVVFEVINPKLNPYEQFSYAKSHNFKIPKYQLVNYNDIINWKSDTDNFLKNLLSEYRKQSKYDIDGIIISHNSWYEKEMSNPKHSIAFKSNQYGKITTVKDIEWAISKYNILIPRIKFDKVDLGSQVEYCTGFNGKYIFNNSLGPGSKIRVVLSGDVIPYIAEIISNTYPKMPEHYNWNENHLHCISLEQDSEFIKKKIHHFIKTLKIDFLSVGIINKLYENEYNTLNKILTITKEQLLKLDGFKETLSDKIIKSIHTITHNPIYLGTLMVASLEFNSGMGIKRITKILDKYPNIMDVNLTLDEIISIDGFQEKTGTQFLDNLSNFKAFLETINVTYFTVREKTVKDKNPKIDKKNFVLTGFRDPEFIKMIEDNGGFILNDISLKTDYLVVKDLESTSSKVKKAKIMGTSIVSKDHFTQMKI